MYNILKTKVMKYLTKNLLMLLMVLAMGVSFASCGGSDGNSKDDPAPVDVDPNEVKYTTWVENHTSSDGSSFKYTLKFATSTAVFEMSYKEGTQTLTDTYSYTFTRSDNLVILNPQEAGNATLEGRIENGIRMSLRNASNNSEICVLYKQ
jgi:hypothetical protein